MKERSSRVRRAEMHVLFFIGGGKNQSHARSTFLGGNRTTHRRIISRPYFVQGTVPTCAAPALPQPCPYPLSELNAPYHLCLCTMYTNQRCHND
jgi:hypothetical protein